MQLRPTASVGLKVPAAAALPATRCLKVAPRMTAARRAPLVVRASSAVAFPPNNSEESQRGLGPQPPQGAFSPSLGVPNVVCARGGGDMGSSGSMGATMERSRLQFVMPTPVVQGPKLDDGGSGGDIGKIIHNGGGGDGGDDDDDDYFNEDGDGDGDGEGEGARDGFFRAVIPESYDKLSIGAVFAEWMRTVQELPAILRQAVAMGLFSSAQLVRFFAVDVRPSVTRAVSRRLPPTLARDFVGRLMADPGFVQKLVIESSLAAAASLWYEYRLRGDKLKGELDLAMINVLGMAAAAGATTWLLAPSRSYGSIQKFPWQQMLDNLPNCVFEASGPLRQYSTQTRAAGFLAKMAELSAVGALMGTATSLLSSAAVAVRQHSNPEWQPSVAVPDVGRSSAGLAAFFAINANARYQVLGGLDRMLFERTNYLWTYMLLTGAARLASNQVGELSRAWWQGLPAAAAGPSFLSAPALPQPRKVRKKVSKKVPKPVAQEPQQTVAMAAASLPLTQGLPGQLGDMSEQSSSSLLQSHIGAGAAEASHLSTSASGLQGGAAQGLPVAPETAGSAASASPSYVSTPSAAPTHALDGSSMGAGVPSSVAPELQYAAVSPQPGDALPQGALALSR